MLGLYLISVILNSVAPLILLVKIWLTKSCFGISGKTQILFVVTYMTRYHQLIFDISDFFYLDDLLFRLLFIFSCMICYYIYVRYDDTNDRRHDTFRIEYLIIFVGLPVLFLNYDTLVSKYLKIFSGYLESVATLPQLFMIIKAGRIEISILCYLITLALSCGYSTAIYCTFAARLATIYHIWAFIIGDIIYCAFFVYMYSGKIKIHIKDSQVENDSESNNNLSSFEQHPEKKQLQSNLNECVLSLYEKDLKRYDSKSTEVLQDTNGSITEAKSTLSPHGVYVIQSPDDFTNKPS